jgi:hypothetical protein
VRGLRLGANLIRGRLGMTSNLHVVLPTAGSSPATLSYPLAVDLRFDRLSTLSAELSRGNWLLAAELSGTDIALEAAGARARLGWEGYYGMVTYRAHERLEVATYYSRFYPDAEDKDGRLVRARGGRAFEAWQTDIALSARIDLSENWLFKLEGHQMDGVGQVVIASDAASQERYWQLLVAKTSYHF